SGRRPERSTSPSFTWPSASTTRIRSRLSMTLSLHRGSAILARRRSVLVLTTTQSKEDVPMRPFGSATPLLAALLSLLAAAPAGAQGVIKLPIVAEITGGGASVGAMWRDAVNLAVEDINKKGGILGMKLETALQDT